MGRVNVSLAGTMLLAAAVIGAGCAGQQTKEQNEAQRKYGSATREPTAVPPPPVPVNPPPAVINPPPPRPGVVAGEPPPPVAAPDPGAPVGNAYRPSWWIGQPAVASGKVTVAAQADGLTLIEARQRVVGEGLKALRAQAGGKEPKNAQTLKTGVARLDSGGYRAFVLMAAEEK